METKKVRVRRAVRRKLGGGWLDAIKNLAPLVVEVIRIVLTRK